MPRTRIVILTLLLGLLLTSGAAAEPAAGPSEVPIYRIAFLANNGQDFDIDLYMIDSDGSNLVRVDTNVLSFSWSPDGQQVVYSKVLGDSAELFTADITGSSTRLFDYCVTTGSGLQCLHPLWSPDGTQIAFDAGDNLSPQVNLYIVDVDGTRIRRVTRSGQTHLDYRLSDWASQGLLSFEACSNRTGLCPIGVINQDGTGHKLVSPEKSGAEGGTFNAAGSRLVYVARSKNGHDMYTVKPSGKGRKRLTDTKHVEGDTTWRPDGRISFLMQGPKRTEHLWRVDANGQNRTKLQGGDNGRPDWRTGDGAAVFFKSFEKQIWLVIGDELAHDLTKIYKPPGFAFYPAWGGEVTAD